MIQRLNHKIAERLTGSKITSLTEVRTRETPLALNAALRGIQTRDTARQEMDIDVSFDDKNLTPLFCSQISAKQRALSSFYISHMALVKPFFIHSL